MKKQIINLSLLSIFSFLLTNCAMFSIRVDKNLIKGYEYGKGNDGYDLDISSKYLDILWLEKDKIICYDYDEFESNEIGGYGKYNDIFLLNLKSNRLKKIFEEDQKSFFINKIKSISDIEYLEEKQDVAHVATTLFSMLLAENGVDTYLPRAFNVRVSSLNGAKQLNILVKDRIHSRTHDPDPKYLEYTFFTESDTFSINLYEEFNDNELFKNLFKGKKSPLYGSRKYPIAYRSFTEPPVNRPLYLSPDGKYLIFMHMILNLNTKKISEYPIIKGASFKLYDFTCTPYCVSPSWKEMAFLVKKKGKFHIDIAEFNLKSAFNEM